MMVFNSTAGTLWHLLYKIWGIPGKVCFCQWSMANICDQWKRCTGGPNAVSLSQSEFRWCPARETDEYGALLVGSEGIHGDAACLGPRQPFSNDRRGQVCKLCSEMPGLWCAKIYHQLCEYTVLPSNMCFSLFLEAPDIVGLLMWLTASFGPHAFFKKNSAFNN